MLKIYRIKTESRKSNAFFGTLEYAWFLERLTFQGWVSAGRSMFGFSNEYARKLAYEQMCKRQEEFILIGKKPKIETYYESGKALKDWKIVLVTPTKLTRQVTDTRTEYIFRTRRTIAGVFVYRTVMGLNEVEAYKSLFPPNINDRETLKKEILNET